MSISLEEASELEKIIEEDARKQLATIEAEQAINDFRSKMIPKEAIKMDNIDQPAEAALNVEERPPLSIRRFAAEEQVFRDGAPVVDGVRYNVVVRAFPGEDPRPVYVADAYTGEKLPTQVDKLVQEGDTWFAKLRSRLPGGWEVHKDMDPVKLVFID